MRYLLDTDTCIAILRGHPKARERQQAVTPDDCGVSTVTIFELFSGVERCRRPMEERRKVEMFLDPLHLLPFDYDAALRSAQVRWDLEKSGKLIGPYDLQLAGQSLALEATFVTGNSSEFDRVRGLRLENWMTD